MRMKEPEIKNIGLCKRVMSVLVKTWCSPPKKKKKIGMNEGKMYVFCA